MAHFAEIGTDNKVLRVIVAETKEWCENNLGGTWVQTSYNTFGGEHKLGGTPLRKNYAGIGYLYDSDRDAFIPPRPFNSWTLNESSCLWEAPVAMPTDGKMYTWDEDSVSWKEVPAL